MFGKTFIAHLWSIHMFGNPITAQLFGLYTGLAISDTASLVTLLWTNTCYTLAFMAADLPFNNLELYYLTSGILHFVFWRITALCHSFRYSREMSLCITVLNLCDFSDISNNCAHFVMIVHRLLWLCTACSDCAPLALTVNHLSWLCSFCCDCSPVIPVTLIWRLNKRGEMVKKGWR